MVNLDEKIKIIIEDMNIDIRELNTRERQRLAQDLARRVRFTKREIFEVLG